MHKWLASHQELAAGTILLFFSWLSGTFRPDGIEPTKRCFLAIDALTTGGLAAGVMYWFHGCQLDFGSLLFAAAVVAGGRPLQGWLIGTIIRRFAPAIFELEERDHR